MKHGQNAILNLVDRRTQKHLLKREARWRASGDWGVWERVVGHEELLTMADRIGVQRKWIQKAGTHHEHFDISLTKRAEAVKAGALQITQRELGLKLIERRRKR